MFRIVARVGSVAARGAAGVACTLALAGCGSDDASAPAATGADTVAAAAPACAYRADWQRLANRIDAPVYCPGWMPDPLHPDIGSSGNNISSLGTDRSYLQSFIWQETEFGGGIREIHVILRGYPGNTKIPSCPDVTTVGGKTFRKKIPCFQDPRGTIRSKQGQVATIYTVNHGADSWHVLFAWRRNGSLYTLSEHVGLPLTYAKVLANLRRMFDGLVRIPPTA